MLVVVLGSYALLKVLRTVGEAVLSVSRRREAPLPKTRGWWVLTESLGRCDGREGIIGSEVAMEGGSAGDDWKLAGAGCCDIADIIMCKTWRWRSGWAQAQTEAVWRGRQPSKVLWPGALAVSADGYEVEVAVRCAWNRPGGCSDYS